MKKKSQKDIKNKQVKKADNKGLVVAKKK